MRLLLVEDDEVQAYTIKQALIAQGYVVDCAADGEEGWDFIEAFTYDLMLLDVSLPKLDGIALCRRLRDRGYSVPVLLLTARSSSTDKVTGLDSGADDYVVKPCTVRELFARIRALLRRRNASGAPLLTWGNLALDPSSHQLYCDQDPIALSPKEYNLLELFLRNPRRVLTHSAILEHLWSFEDPPSEGTVRAHIKRLRRKLREVGITEMIETVYGVGYRLRENPPEPPTTPASEETEPPANPAPHLQELWDKFRPQMQERLVPLKSAIAAAQKQKLDADLAQTAATAAHKLAGSLGIFGLKSGYTLAQKVEQQLLNAIATQDANLGVMLTPEVVQDIQNLIEIVQNPPENFTAPASSPPPSDPKTIPGAIAQVLVVDDDAELAQNLQTAAASWNFQVEIALTLEAARNAIATQVPDLVLLDIAFPNAPQGGLTLLEDLKQQYPRLPILIFSARDRLSDRAAICQTTFNPNTIPANTVSPHPAPVHPLPNLAIPGMRGGDAFLSKHIPVSEVMATIAEMLKPATPSATKILIVDDDPITLENIKNLLALWGFTPIPLSDPRLFWEMLETHAPDLLILDYKMPHYNGLQLCQIVRNDPTWQGLPILFATSETQPDIIQKIYQHGADDYVAKPFSEAELIARICNRLERVQLLRSLAETDVLTGLMNRRRGSQDLNRYLRLCQRQEQMFSLILLDVDDFKPINDRYGHGVGDRVLRQLGIFLQHHFRQEDVVARWGGDEFMIGLYAMPKFNAQQRIQTLLNHTIATPLSIAGQVQLSLRLSFGVATYPDDGDDLPSLYRAADRELYRWKAKKKQNL